MKLHLAAREINRGPVTTLAIEKISYQGILTDITLELQAGSMVGLLGPNGAGKSTLLRLVTGIWRPSRGEICVDGVSLQKMSSKLRARYISYLPQHLPEQVSFTVGQYVEMGRYPYSRYFSPIHKRHREEVQEALTLLQLLEFRDTQLDKLSGGEQQRAGIARCLAQESRIMVLDEPISSLDLYHQVDILARLRNFADKGYLVIIAIHNLELAARYCTHLVLMSQGRLHSSGSPNEVLTERAVHDVFRIRAKTYNDPFSGSWRLTHVE